MKYERRVTEQSLAEEKSSRLSNTKTMGVRLNEQDVAALNQRFKIDGYQTMSEFVKSYIDGEITRRNNSDQVERLYIRLKDRNITDPLTGEITPTFYKNVDLEDFRQYLKRKYRYGRYGDSLVSYYQRFAELFFTKSEIIQLESGIVHGFATQCGASANTMTTSFRIQR